MAPTPYQGCGCFLQSGGREVGRAGRSAGWPRPGNCPKLLPVPTGATLLHAPTPQFAQNSATGRELRLAAVRRLAPLIWRF